MFVDERAHRASVKIRIFKSYNLVFSFPLKALFMETLFL